MPNHNELKGETGMSALLPQLREDHNVSLPSLRGAWHPVGADVLGAIGKGLSADIATEQINSIPDVWARLLLFEMALFDVNHSLHDQVLAEWRGLLAVLALKDILNLTEITVDNVDLTVARNQRDVVLHNALIKLLPNSSPFPDTSWKSMFVFATHGKPFGITSPTTLVATATSYSYVELPAS